MSKENPSDLARQVMNTSATDLEEAAAALEVEADFLRQSATLLRRGDADAAMALEDQLKAMERKCDEKLSDGREKLRMLEMADKEYWEHVKATDIARLVEKLSVEQAKISLLAHNLECGEGAKCDVHKALHERIKRG